MKIALPLHLQIVIALILGAVFGAIFHVGKYDLILKFNPQTKQVDVRISHWTQLIVIHHSDTLKTFGKDDQIAIISFFNQFDKELKKQLTIDIRYSDKITTYNNVHNISKPATIATYIKPIGTIFIRLLSFLAIPLVLASLIVGASSLNDAKKIGSIGLKTISFYIVTTIIAITLGLLSANIIKPGSYIPQDTKLSLLSEDSSDITRGIADNMQIDIVDFLVNIVPTNPIKAIADGNMLQIVFFAVLFGITLTFINRKKAEPVISVFDGISSTMIKMVNFIMLLAPYGVFALIAATVADFGFWILSTLAWYMLAVIIALLLHTVIVYSSIVKVFGKMSPFKFFKGIREAQVIGFSTSSSAATLPVTIDCVENNLKIPKRISGFVLPLGATINMDGTALYQGVAAVFIAQVYGIDLGLTGQLTIVITAVLASIGTAPVPGVGLIMLVMILQSVNIPPEGIALIMGVDRILDMLRTITNVSGDAAVTVALSGTEK